MRFNKVVVEDLTKAFDEKGLAEDEARECIILDILYKEDITAQDLEELNRACFKLSMETKVKTLKKSKYFRIVRTFSANAWTGKTTAKEIRFLKKYRILVD